MTRRILLGALVVVGCVPAHVAAVELEGSGDGEASGVSGSDGGTSAACEVPGPMEGCDAFADPLRAPELACHDGISAAAFESPDGDAWRRAHEFANAFWVSPTSDAVLVLSTGRLPLATPSGQVALDPGAAQLAGADNNNPDAATLPDPMNPSPGSAVPYIDCDGVGDCSHTLAPILGAANDLVWLRVDAEVPDDARGYTARVAFFTAEYPERLEAPNADAFIWWTTSESYTGNLATLAGAPATVSGLAPLLSDVPTDDPMLARTGFDGGTGESCTHAGVTHANCPIGSTTGWMTLHGPASPGERLTIALALFDQVDAQLDTIVLVDDWRWTCAPCVPGDSCGLSPA